MLKSRKLTKEDLEYALMGGAILGGGGGGSMELGRISGEIALEYGELELRDINLLEDNELLVTASAVGAPAAPDKYVKPNDYVKTMKMIRNVMGEEIGGIITNENGGAATINGWIQAAVLGLPLIDAPCNGRAHPTGTMGSMGLNNLEGYVSYQTFSGGDPKKGNKIEGNISGNISKTSKIVREAAVHAGGLVAVARNPVSVKYVKENAAIGGITHAIETGRVFYESLAKSPENAVKEVSKFLGGEVVIKGEIEDFELVTTGGFDVGKVVVSNSEMTFWNEYMTLETNGERHYTFPDLIMTFDSITGFPLTTAELTKGMNITIIATKRHNIKLGSGMFDEKLLKEVEPIINKEIVNYNK